jgi:hypothetical protein
MAGKKELVITMPKVHGVCMCVCALDLQRGKGGL